MKNTSFLIDFDGRMCYYPSLGDVLTPHLPPGRLLLEQQSLLYLYYTIKVIKKEAVD
jgi:hypothetical protein